MAHYPSHQQIITIKYYNEPTIHHKREGRNMTSIKSFQQKSRPASSNGIITTIAKTNKISSLSIS